MKLLDPNDPFFRRPMTRVLSTVLPLAWAGVELWNGQPIWAAGFALAGAYVGYMLYFRRDAD